MRRNLKNRGTRKEESTSGAGHPAIQPHSKTWSKKETRGIWEQRKVKTLRPKVVGII